MMIFGKGKLYVSRYVPYGKRVRAIRLSSFKMVAAIALFCAAIISVTVFASGALPVDFHLKFFGGKVTTDDKEKEENKGYFLPEPDADARAKADRLREMNVEDYNEHRYSYKKNELEGTYVYDSNKVCYLTFDDGPSNVTGQILDTLKAYKIKATFFITGVSAEKNPKLVRRIYDEGHAIGNHSYSHDYTSVYASPQQFSEEIEKCKNAIDKALGFEYKSHVLRFPGGSDILKDDPLEGSYLDAVGNAGYKFADWNCLTGDSNTTEPTEQYLEQTLKYTESVSKTGDIVVLMHDSSTKKITADYLPKVIEYLDSLGYKFKTLKNS